MLPPSIAPRCVLCWPLFGRGWHTVEASAAGRRGEEDDDEEDDRGPDRRDEGSRGRDEHRGNGQKKRAAGNQPGSSSLAPEKDENDQYLPLLARRFLWLT